MKIVLAPNAFKESITAPDAARALAEGVKRAQPDAMTIEIPLADGGDGTVEALVAARDGEFVDAEVHDPLMRLITSRYGLIDDGRIAVIEMAEASGLRLLSPEERNPMKTSTYGTGELIRHALDRGVDGIVIGIGGSATTEGGAGAAAALGFELLDKSGVPVSPTGEGIADIAEIRVENVHPRLYEARIEIASDVTNPLVGPQGAAAIFGPQKGASPQMVERLEAGLRNLANVWERCLSYSIGDTPGGGAAGGLGAGLLAFCRAEMRSGFELAATYAGLDEALEGASLVITGEGKIDESTQYGKVPFGVAVKAKAKGVPAVALAGGVSGDLSSLYESGMAAIFSITPGPVSLENAMANAETYLRDAAEQVIRLRFHR